MKLIDFGFRVVLLAWGCVELLGYLWGGSLPKSANDIYLATPAVALLLGAVLPNAFLRKVSGICIVSLFALLAVVRSAHQAQIDLSLTHGGDIGAASLRALTAILVLMVVGKAIYLYKKPAPPNPSSGNVSGSIE